MKILILGITGMLGHVLFKELSKNRSFSVLGTTRSLQGLDDYFDSEELTRIRSEVDADNFDTVIRAFASFQPDVVINCIGLIKQLPEARDPLTAIKINALFPHRLAQYLPAARARLIHISTDCVFNGKKGNYSEADPSDAEDLYGRSKFLGEVDYRHCITLRTSIIGHELKSNVSLVDWFLSQKEAINGFTAAMYSGLTTLEMSRIILDHVLPRPDLSGVYHVSAARISKYDLLQSIAEEYRHKIDIKPCADFVIDRSLDSTRFRQDFRYAPPAWETMIQEMAAHFFQQECYRHKPYRSKDV